MDFKYNVTQVTGDKWKRANSITIYNELDSTPHVMFTEEHVAQVDGETLQRPAGELTVLIDEATMMESFPILNSDGTPSEMTGSVVQLAALLTSAYVHFADLRDAQVAAWEEEERLREEERQRLEDEANNPPEDPETPDEGEGDPEDPEEPTEP